jgi:drug/metabolite transporter (DMT)-like permease
MRVRDPQVEKALLCLSVAIVFFASIPVFLKHFTAALDGWTVNGVRYAFGALFWLPLVIRWHRRVPPGRNIWRDAVPPACVNVVGQTGWALSPYFNDASMMGFVARSSFLFTIIFGFWLLHEERRLARSVIFWVGVAGTACGLIALYSGGAKLGSTSPVGLAILLGTSASWGLYSVLVRRHMRGHSIRLSFGVISLYTSVGLLVLMLLFGAWGRLADVTLGGWGLLVLSAMLGIALGHVLFYRAIHELGPIVSEGGLLLIPFVTVLGAGLFLGERMGALQWGGGIALVAGSLCLLLARKRGSANP